MATAEELKAYLNKRGFSVNITNDELVCHITLLKGDAKALSDTLSKIREPYQFVIHPKINKRMLVKIIKAKNSVWHKIKGLANIIKRGE